MNPADIKAPIFLRNLWYFAAHSKALRPGKLLHKTMLGEPLVLARSPEGEAFALRDLCPHRGVPLSAGRMVEGTVECPYHGWRFDPSGRCRHIPSLVGEELVTPEKISVRKYPVAERNGLIWVYFADEIPAVGPAEPPPSLPLDETYQPTLIEAQEFPCMMDHAVVGLMDPAHGPFVHRSWWWRTEASIYEKAKRYEQSHLGFTMAAHAPSKNSKLYKLLGGDKTTEISFQLPGIRVEDIRAGKNRILGLTTCTPIDANRTMVTQTFYWNISWLAPFKPVIQSVARAFLGQDRKIVETQQEGLRHNPRLMLIKDADTPAIWYYQLKREWAEATKQARPFNNPVVASVLKWRS